MMPAPHIFGRIILELNLRGRDRVTAVQDRVSAFAGGRLHSVLTTCLAVSGNNFVTIKKLELDIGEVSLDNLEEDLASGIAQAMREWLLGLPWGRDEVQLLPQESATGDPWSQSAIGGEDASLLLAEGRALTSSGLNAAVACALRGSGDWSQLLAAVRENHALRGRLAGEVSLELLHGLLRSMVPEHGAWMANLSAVLLALHNRGPLVSADHHSFRRALWECILLEAARQRSSSVTPRAFVAGISELLAAHYSLQSSALIAEIARRLRETPPATSELISLAGWRSDPRPTAASYLSDEDRSWWGRDGQFTVAPQQGQASHRAMQRFDDLARFLEWGAIPGAMMSRTARDAESEILDLIATSPAEIAALVSRKVETPSVRKRIAGQFSESVIHRLLSLLDPIISSWMIFRAGQLRRLHAQAPLVRLGNRGFAQKIGETALQFLGERHEQCFEASWFLRYLLQRLAGNETRSYELLLAKIALRRPRRKIGPRTASGSGPQSALESAILALLHQDILGVKGYAPKLLNSPAQPASPGTNGDTGRDLGGAFDRDLDTVALWLQARSSPHGIITPSPAEARSRLPAELPHDAPLEDASNSIQPGTAVAQPSHENYSSDEAQTASTSTGPLESWLLHGICPTAGSLPQRESLSHWLETQDDTTWLQALRRCGAQEQVVNRIVAHLPYSFLLRITTLLAGPSADSARGYLDCLQAACARRVGMASSAWDEQVRRYALIYLLRAASSPRTPNFSVEDFAHHTLQALSLRCQVSYERLLMSVRAESLGQSALEGLWRNLGEDLDRISAARAFATDSPISGASVSQVDLVLHYLRYASLPEGAPEVTLQNLRRMVEAFSDDELSKAAHSCLSLIANDRATAHRVAALLSPEAFTRWVACLFPSFNFVGDLENALSRAATRLSLPTEQLLLAERTFLVGYVSHHEDESGSDKCLRMMHDLLSMIARRAGISSAQLLSELEQASDSNGELAKVLGDLRRALARYPAGDARHEGGSEGDEQFGSILSFTTAAEIERQSAALGSRQISGQPVPVGRRPVWLSPRDKNNVSSDRLQGRLHALAHFLRTGDVPWWAEAMARRSSSRWFSALLRANPGPLLQTLRSVSPSPQAVERLLRYVPRESLESIVHQASPAYGGFALLYINAGAGLAESDELTLSQRSHASRAHWRETLRFLLDDHSTQTVPAEFLRIVCRRVCRQLSLTTDRYSCYLIQVVRRRAKEEIGYRALEEMLTQVQEMAVSPTGVNAGVSAPQLPLFLSAEAAPESHGALEAPESDVNNRQAHQQTSRIGCRDGSKLTSEDFVGDPVFPDVSTPVGQFKYFLRYGELPPGAKEKIFRQFVDEVAEDARCHPSDYRSCLQESAGRALERKRMTALLSLHFPVHPWPLLLPRDHALAALCLDLLQTAGTSCAGRNQQEPIRRTCIEELLRTASLPRGRRWDAALYLRCAIQQMVENFSLRAALVVERMREKLARQTKDTQTKLAPVLDRVEAETALIPIMLRPHSPDTEPKARPADRFKKPSELPAGEPFYIANAGAVLLWPFLSRYFQILGLLEEKDKFRSELERSRAIHLVQYLAIGQMEAPEPELLLNKILCGARPEQPLETVSPVTAEEEELSLQMLHGLLENWHKLSNTSIEGLRQSFLMREGRLVRKDKEEKSWSLVVSTKGYDVLLDSLPWRLSMIRLPWMQTMLYVKWR